MNTLKVILSEGFRTFFLAAAVFAIAAIGLWLVWIGVLSTGASIEATPFAPPAHLMHAHEMIFGYAPAAIAGFMLTAVPTWTGAPAPGRAVVVTLAALWLAGRLVLWFSGALDPLFVAVIDLVFLPALALWAARQLARRPKPPNLMFLGLLALLWTGNLLVHLDWLGRLEDGAGRGLQTGLLGVATMIAVIGGRVTPAFTRNALKSAGHTGTMPRSHWMLEVSGIASAILLTVLTAADVHSNALATLALFAGLAQAARLAGWQGRRTLGQPILWSLHLGFAWLAIGYLALGLAGFGLIGEVVSLHVLGIGAVGGMTLAVMSRAILGHSGRTLVAPRAVAIAYGLVPLSVLARAAGNDTGFGLYLPAMILSGALWIGAFVLFLIALWPPISRPRAAANP